MNVEQTTRTGIRHPLDETVPGPGEAIEAAPGVLWMRLPLPMKLDHVNVYALDEADGWTIVDTGFDTAESREGWAALLRGPLAGRPVRRVVATHHHPDHIGLAGWFMAEQEAELWTTRTAWLFARMLMLDHQDRPTEESIRYYVRAGAPDDWLAAYREREPLNFSRVATRLPLGFLRLKEGDRVEMGGRSWRVRTGDGHAPEHATFWSLDDNLVIAGDQVLPRISPNLGVYPTEPEADPVGEWLASCARFLGFSREHHLALPGHHRPFTGVPLRLTQLIENHHGALNRLRDFLAEPRTAVDCFATLFKREIGAAEFGLATVESVAHLNHLHLNGEVERTIDENGAYRYVMRR